MILPTNKIAYLNNRHVDMFPQCVCVCVCACVRVCVCACVRAWCGCVQSLLN